MEELFGEVIYAYTRKQAVEDGEQVDLSEADAVKEAGFQFPVYMTRRVWDVCVEVPDNKPTQDLQGRMWDVLWMARNAIKRANGNQTNFVVKVVTEKGARNQFLVAMCGPKDIDDASPAITIMYPDEN